jgi:hypothetical protein
MTEMRDDTHVIAPARPISYEDEQRVLFEATTDALGKRVGLAFTSVRLLVQAMGDDQPWVCLPLRALKEFHAAAGIDQLVVDARFEKPPEGDE